MPKYTPSDEEMDGSYGGGGPAVAPPDKAAPASTDESQSVDDQNAASAEMVIGKDKLPPGTKEGDTCTFKVSKDVGDEFILAYVKDEAEDETGEQTNDNMNATTESELSAMDAEGA